MIIFAKIYKSLHYKDFIPQNVHPAKICAHYLDELNLGMHKKMRLTNTCKPLSAEREALEPMLSENIIKLQIIDNHI